MSEPWLIVGLGNPGPAYETTRHNVGQLALDTLAARHGLRFSAHRTGARTAEGVSAGSSPEKLILAKSNGYMNASGGPVSALAQYFTVPVPKIIVLHDDLDLPFAVLKLKQGGGHGGHNGVRNIVQALRTPEFLRVRIGIGRPPGRQHSADFVLRPFSARERADLGILCEEAADATEGLVHDGLLATQQRVHGRAARNSTP